MANETISTSLKGMHFEKDPYHILADAIPQIVWTARPDGYNDYFNKRWFEYTGFSEEQTYHGDEDVIHADDWERYLKTWKDALRTGKDYEIEYRFRRASDGMFRWHLGRGTAVHNEKGDIVKWLGTCTDIHDQKMAAEKISQLNEELETKVQDRTRELSEEIRRRKVAEAEDKANLQRLQRVLGSMSLGGVMLDETQRILHANKRFCDMFHLDISPEQLAGKPADEVLAMIAPKLQDPETAIKTLREHIGARMPKQHQEVFLKNGEILSREYVPIIVDGAYRGDLLLYRDVTQDRRVDAAKSEFMSLASHQLRTPLTAIRWIFGKLNRLSREHMTPSEMALVEEGKAAASRMADTIDTMLTISRIESGNMSLNLTEANVHSLLSEIIDAKSALYQFSHEHIRLQCPEDLTLKTDPNLFREIMRNLIGNAIKYTPPEGRIDVHVQKLSDSTEIQIRDTGLGIPLSQQEKIFSKFFRGSNAIATKTQGTGLGLYLVHLLISLLNGHISFESAEGKGTVFTVRLPGRLTTV